MCAFMRSFQYFFQNSFGATKDAAIFALQTILMLPMGNQQKKFGAKRIQSNGGLAQLARALAWHARGRRFDPDTLHKTEKITSLWFFLFTG
jgi:hypothetical protein